MTLAVLLCSWLDGFDPVGDAAMEKRIKKSLKKGEEAAEVKALRPLNTTMLQLLSYTC
jgi:hypothetical protein